MSTLHKVLGLVQSVSVSALLKFGARLFSVLGAALRIGRCWAAYLASTHLMP